MGVQLGCNHTYRHVGNAHTHAQVWPRWALTSLPWLPQPLRPPSLSLCALALSRRTASLKPRFRAKHAAHCAAACGVPSPKHKGDHDHLLRPAAGWPALWTCTDDHGAAVRHTDLAAEGGLRCRAAERIDSTRSWTSRHAEAANRAVPEQGCPGQATRADHNHATAPGARAGGAGGGDRVARCWRESELCSSSPGGGYHCRRLRWPAEARLQEGQQRRSSGRAAAQPSGKSCSSSNAACWPTAAAHACRRRYSSWTCGDE